MTDDVIRWHLSGFDADRQPFVAGVYPLLQASAIPGWPADVVLPSDPVAYRRDRRKDQLLQENGYLVLRFLAEDVGKELNLVLDAILRAVGHRRASAPDVHLLTFARRLM